MFSLLFPTKVLPFLQRYLFSVGTNLFIHCGKKHSRAARQPNLKKANNSSLPFLINFSVNKFGRTSYYYKINIGWIPPSSGCNNISSWARLAPTPASPSVIDSLKDTYRLGTSSTKKTGKCGNLEKTGGGVYPNPTSFVIWPSGFLHAKFILRC